MLRPSERLSEVYLCVEPVDFRKRASGLSVLVQDELGMSPFAEKLFVFTNRRRTQCAMMYWERTGFVLWTKRLERNRFHWPRSVAKTVRLSGRELNWLLDGFDLSKWRPHEALAYEYVA